MFNNVAIDVFIGLIAIYLLYSLLASILMEVVAKYLGLRARITQKAIAKILDDSSFDVGNGISRICKSIADAWKFFFQNSLDDRHLTALFYSHPNIKNLGQNNLNRKPAYISPEMFANTTIQILRGDNFKGTENQIELIKQTLKLEKKDEEGLLDLPSWYSKKNYNLIKFNNLSFASLRINFFSFFGINSPLDKKELEVDLKKELLYNNNRQINIHPSTLYQLKQLLFDSHQDIDWFKKKLIEWYNETMERADGWYIRQTRGILFIIGFIIAFTFDIDSIYIAQELAKDNNVTARERMIEIAAQLNNTNYNGEGKKDSALLKLVSGKLDEVNKNLKTSSSIIGGENKCDRLHAKFWETILGYFLTGIAISLGAPFWFDLLGKIMTIRQTGPKSGTPENKNTKKDPTEEPVG
jgi:hypothetical protein